MAFALPDILGKCDSTLLKSTATEKDIIALCDEAKAARCAAVCVNSSYVPLVKRCLEGTDVKTCAVIAFPLGAMSTKGKVEESRAAVAEGADEIDMVIHIGRLLEKKYQYVQDEIASVVKATEGKIVKVIIETCYLTDDEKLLACDLAMNAGAHFVKTSTGFGEGGATVSDVALIRHSVGKKMGVKASGGIRTAQDASAMLEAGASRIGTGSLRGIIDSYS